MHTKFRVVAGFKYNQCCIFNYCNKTFVVIFNEDNAPLLSGVLSRSLAGVVSFTNPS